jgi:hypothetical protein
VIVVQHEEVQNDLESIFLLLALTSLWNLFVLSLNVLKNLSMEFLSPNVMWSHLRPYLSTPHGYEGPPSTSTTGLLTRVLRTILTKTGAAKEDLW